MAEHYKELLILNKSMDAKLTLYIYYKDDPLCWLSLESKTIPPNTKHFHCSKKSFKFKLVVRSVKEQRPKTTLLETQKWVEDKAFEVTESLDRIEGKLADYPREKQICLRNLQRDKEMKITCGRRNLYEILGLNTKEVRKMKKEDQKEAIEKGFREQMRIWHPDKHSGDDEIAKELIVARDLLLDEEKRARYNNEADYDEGWLSPARWKAIFRPECVTEEQKKAYRKRIKMLLLSALAVVGGIGITIGTAGAAGAGVVIAGAILGSGLAGAGLQSLPHTINKKAVVDECDVKQWLLKAGIGVFSGAATGGIGVGITAAVVGLGEKALSSAVVSAGQYIGIGASIGTAVGVVSSLTSDAARKFVDGEDVSLKQAVGHALSGAVIGAATGAAVGAVIKAFAVKNTSAASSNIEGDILEQVVRAETQKGGRKLGYAIAQGVSQKVTACGTESVMGTAFQFLEERLDDSVENQHPLEHLKRGSTNLVANSMKGAVGESAGALSSHGFNELVHVRPMVKEVLKKKDVLKNKHLSKLGNISEKSVLANENVSNFDEVLANPQELRQKIRHINSIENREHLFNWRGTNCSATYEPTKADESSMIGHQECDVTFGELEEDVTENGKVKYISEGYWFSKMIVHYTVNGVKIKKEVRGSGKFVTIPSCATQIEVSFQVRRPFWGDVMKYDRFEGSWCKPYEPHVFRYETPPIRTFTISGNLRWEAVMRVSNEYHEERKQMVGEIK